MIRAVATHGFPKTTLATIVDLASVSRTTFYRHFADKEDCFLQTHDLIIETGARQISEAYRSGQDWRERLHNGFHTFMTIVASDPDAAQLVIIEALSAGPEATRRRDAAAETFELLFRQSFDQARAEGRVSDVTIRAIVGGIRRVVYVHLRDGTTDQLPGYVDDLLDWALSYQEPGVNVPRKPPVRPTRTAPQPPQELLPSERPAPERRKLGHRRRIVESVTTLVARHGYSSLSIPDISAGAGISNQTFYAHFKSKEEALLGASSDLAAEAIDSTTTAFDAAPAWPEAVRAGLDVLLGFLAVRPAFARLAMIELLSAGHTAQQHADLVLDGFGAFLVPAEQRAPRVPDVVVQAITGGAWNVIHYEYTHDRLDLLPSMTASLAYIILAPFLGAAKAAEIAHG